MLLGIVSIGILVSPVEASTSDLFINHLDFQVQMNEDGTMDVTEKWEIEVENTNTLYKTFKIDKTRYSDITNVEVLDITNGSKIPFKQSSKWQYHLPKGSYFGGINQSNQYEISWGVGLENTSANKVYEISYQVTDAIAKYSDYAEIYWQFVGEDFEIDANQITGTIFLPQHVSNKEEIKVWGHTEDLNGEIYATNTNKIDFKVNQFRAGRYVEIRALFPTNQIKSTLRGENIPRLEQVVQEETVWANQANHRRQRKEQAKGIFIGIINVIAIIVSIFMIKSILKTIEKIKTSHKLTPSQEMKYFREMPREDATPAEAISILQKQIGGLNSSVYLGKIFSATLLDLCVKKIIDFEENNKIITIKILQEHPMELENNKDEKVIFEFLKKACQNGKITTKELEKYIQKKADKVLALGTNIDQKTKQALYEKKLVDQEGKKQKTELLAYTILLAVGAPLLVVGLILMIGFSSQLFGVLVLLIAMMVQFIAFCILSAKTNVLTQKGIDENEKWKGLKKYMQDFSMLHEKEVPQIVIWERFLVYATAFGIARQVLKQLKMVYPNMEKEFSTNHYAYWYLMMHTDFSNSFSSSISTSMSSAYSSATGGGGGFSVGGRRPDGGRRRRRRKITASF